MPGIAVEIIALLTNYLNLTIDVVDVRGYTSDYSYISKELENNETDLYATFSNPTTHTTKFNSAKDLYRVCFK
jgi:hypothetical protein